jgi:DNA-binding IscR family transcriptional regulator
VLVEVADGEGGLQPAHPPGSITIADVLHIVRTNEDTCVETPKHPTSEPIEQMLLELAAVVRSAPANANFAELARRLE